MLLHHDVGITKQKRKLSCSLPQKPFRFAKQPKQENSIDWNMTFPRPPAFEQDEAYKAKKKGNNHRRNKRHSAAASVPPTPLTTTTPRRWKPHSDDKEEDNETRNARLLRRLLNKLTPTNLHKLVSEFLHEISSSTASAMVPTIVHRAASDARFGDMYALLCQRLVAEMGREFRKELWRYFQDELLTMMTSEVHAPKQQRHEFLGTQRFLGNLCNGNVLCVEEVLWACDMLLEQTQLLSDDKYDSSSICTIQPVPLEGLCILLATCGQTLEGTVTSFAILQTIWNVLQTLTEQESEQTNRLSFRMRHLVMELLELRGAAWQPTRYGARCRQALVAKPIVAVAVADQDRVAQPCHKKKHYRGVRFASKHQTTKTDNNENGNKE